MASEALRARIGENVRELRKARELKQYALAATISTDVGTISRLERGEVMPSIGRLEEIAAALDVDISELFADESPDRDQLSKRFARRMRGYDDKTIDMVLKLATHLVATPERMLDDENRDDEKS